MTREEITNLIEALGDLMIVLSEADPADTQAACQRVGHH
jgi:hypothetical protein